MNDAEYYGEEGGEDSRYLLFSLGNELYGTPLLGVREVVEPQTTKVVPNTLEDFTGVINIRGEIVGVVDLRKRFERPAANKTHMALMVFDTEGGPMAALVDKVEAVAALPPAKIEHRPNIPTRAPLDYLIGIGQHDEKLVTLIDLNKILGIEEIVSLRGAR